EIAATSGTAAHLREHGIEVATVVAKLGEAGGTDAVELISSGKVQLVVNSPRGRGPRADGAHIRTAAGANLVPPLTTAAAGLAGYVDLASLGAVVVKSLAAEPWPGNAAPRVHETQGGMLNSVGLQGPGVEAWLRDELPPLLATGATVVASIWGRTVDEYAAAA